ncbi:MAG: 23S rRNA (pseudouridine(1915)-N(3))-methyltransferase RlmH [Woeseiaceae bacterium]|nr:23S rRNA (pseudouridine(1915)-N(3))-methyltransferase RlmH [Woeseiaceae bacterium]
MHLRVAAIGERPPDWVAAGVDSYAQRLPRDWQFRVDALPAAKRSRAAPASRARDDESNRLLAATRRGDRVVLLDERGGQRSSADLAARLADWQGGGRDVVFLIGGPDGVSDACHERADECWSLSMLTLPHGLARILLVEQLYRAWSLLNNHPYHRE